MAKELRDALADQAIAINKGQDKIVSKLDELQTKKEEKVESHKEDKKASQQAILSQIKGVEDAVKNQKEVESISINNPEAITGDLKTGLQGIIEALKTELKNFDKNIVVKNDFSNLASLFKSSQDKTSVINALKAIENKLDKPEKEQVDYTLILSDIATALEAKNNDDVIKVLKDVLAKEYNVQFPGIMDVNLDPKLIENDRVRMVLPDEQVAKMSEKIAEGSNTRLVTENQTSGDQKTQIVDADGNIIDSHLSSDGGYHLATALIQDIQTSSNNTTTTNLASGATFTGTAEETFGVNGIQVFHTADQNCTVYIDQSLDDTFSSSNTVTDSTFCLANDPCTRTLVSVAPYFRIRITNNGDSATTSINSAAGMTPIINPLPRSLTEDGRLMSESTLSGRENTNRHVWVNPTNELAISPVYRMVGTSFDGSVKDPNFWTDGSLRDGTVTQDGGEVELETNTTANGLALYQSVRKARFVAGSAQYFNGGFNFVTAGTSDNTRRLGAYTLDGSLNVEDGFYFQLAGTTFSIGYARAGTPTLVNSGSFNGNYGVNFVPTADTYYSLAIEFTPLGAFWYVNGKLLHKIAQAHMSDTNTLPITLENENTGDSTTDVAFDCVGAYIARQGELHTNPTSKYMTTGTHILKYGAGILTKIIVGDNVSGSVTVYDNTAASGTLLTVLDTAVGSSPLGAMDYNLPFNDGLTIVIVGNNKITVVYE